VCVRPAADRRRSATDKKQEALVAAGPAESARDAARDRTAPDDALARFRNDERASEGKSRRAIRRVLESSVLLAVLIRGLRDQVRSISMASFNHARANAHARLTAGARRRAPKRSSLVDDEAGEERWRTRRRLALRDPLLPSARSASSRIKNPADFFLGRRGIRQRRELERRAPRLGPRADRRHLARA